MINKEVKVITCHGIVVDKYAICPLWHSFIDLSIVSSLVHLLILSCWHWPTKPASQSSVISFQSFISFIRILSFFFIHFSFFRFFVHLFVDSFVLFSLIIDIFSLSDDSFLDTIFRIRCLTRHTKNLFLLKNRHNRRRSWDESVIPWVRSILLVTVVYKHYILLRMIKGEKQTKKKPRKCHKLSLSVSAHPTGNSRSHL